MNRMSFFSCHLLIEYLHKAIQDGWLYEIEIDACLITGDKADFKEIWLIGELATS